MNLKRFEILFLLNNKKTTNQVKPEIVAEYFT